ncbi:FAD/NAD(P)-binding domain-containing protein [Tricholoma matsutake]|nr:FAD/NAD(P)-binding domain-containing protein [Tricholoma matsutake 945]
MTSTQQTPYLSGETLDVLIVGAGFSGIHLLHQLRSLGLSAKIFEAGGGLGGTWYWNCYPGARTDSDFSIYQFSMEELWRGWTWSERFPSWKELRAYFDYVDKKLDISKDVAFNKRIISADFDADSNRWAVTAQDGTIVHSRFFILCTGLASKPYTPPYPGLDTFKGTLHHTGLWPQDGVDLCGKRIGVIGTGASGVQLIQESGPRAAHLTVFQRTPNFALPMVQQTIDSRKQDKMKEHLYPYIFRRRYQTFAGFQFNGIPHSMFSISPEERLLQFEDLWSKGGFNYWLGVYQDMFLDQNANNEVYRFWQKKVADRLENEEMRRKLAPEVAPHPFGVKRPCLEQRYYEVYNQPNVDLIDVSENPILEITPKGVKTEDGKEHELDVLVLATGFDAVSGSIAQIDIRGTDGELVRDKWEKGLSTYLGLTVAKYPNLFFTYGPHGPTGFCNGPTCAEFQGDWIVNCIKHMRTNDFTRVEATDAAQTAYVEYLHKNYEKYLWGKAKSWYNGANIPGKVVESLNFAGGVPLYIQLCNESAEKGYDGFVFSKPEGAHDKSQRS